MKVFRILIFSSVMLAVGIAFGVNVKTDYDRAFDFGRLKTFAFKEQTRPAGNLLQRNALVDNRIRDALKRELLKTNVPTVVDFLVLVDDSRLPTGAQSWYDQLTPGAYELSIQRRTGCCDGPMIESNKINFEVVP